MEKDEAQKVQLVSVVSDWTLDTLKQYFDRTLESVDKRITADVTHAKESATSAQANSQLANSKAEKASDDRFASHNEFNKRIDAILAQTVTLGAFTQFKDQYAADKLAMQGRMADFVTTAQFAEMRASLTAITTRLNLGVGETVGKEKTVDNARANIAILFGAGGLIVSIALVIITLLARHGT